MLSRILFCSVPVLLAVGPAGCLFEPLPPHEPVPAPFTLDAEQSAELEAVLAGLAARQPGCKTAVCRFVRFQYDPVFGDDRTPRHVDRGEFACSEDGRWMFDVTHADAGGEAVPIEPERRERWIAAGDTLYQYDYMRMPVVRHDGVPDAYVLPARLAAAALLGDAARLREDWHLRVATPANTEDQLRLEIHPAFKDQQASLRRAELMLDAHSFKPVAVQFHHPNDKGRTVYTFEDVRANGPIEAKLAPTVPDGWHVEQLQVPEQVVP